LKGKGAEPPFPLNKFEGESFVTFSFWGLKPFLDLQTGLHVLSQPIIKAFLVLKPFGPIKSTMAIMFSPQIWLCL
jgi:hypothetical protein